MAKCLLLLLTLNVFVLLSADEISRFVCHAEGSNIEDALKSKNYDVLSFDEHTKRFSAHHCSWEISKPNFGSHLSLDSAVLNENDTLTITGRYETNYEMDYRKRNRGSTTLFRTTGNFSQKGFVYLAGYDSIYVSLWFEKNALSKDDIRKNDPRTLSIVYYKSVVELSENTGQLTFFRNADQKPITNGKIVLRPVKSLRDDKLVMLNFTQISYGIPGLNSNPRVTVDGVQLNTSALPAVFLQSPSSDNITVIVNMLETEPITIHYLLVNRHCNEGAVLRVEDQARPNASFQTPKIMTPPAQVCPNNFEKNTISKTLTGQKNLSVRLKYATITDKGGSSTFYAVDPSKSVITLSSSIGQVTVLLSRDRQNQTAQTSLQFTPEEINGQLIMLNFTQLPVNSKDTKVTVDGVQLNSTFQTMFLQSPSSSVITVTMNMTGGQQQVEPITLRWWLVSKRCSEKAVLRIGGGLTAAIARNPADVFKAPRQPPGTPLRCATYLSTKTDARFAVHIFSPGGVADPADSVHFLDARGQAVVPGEQNNRLCNERTVLIDSSTAVILYESPYSSSLYADYRAPEVRAIPKRGSLGYFLSGLLPFCVN